MDALIVVVLVAVFGVVCFVAGLLVMRKHYNRVKEAEAAAGSIVKAVKGG